MLKYWWLLIPAAILAGLFFPYTTEIKETIKADLLAVTEVTTKPANISKWYTPFYNDTNNIISNSEIRASEKVLKINLKDPTSTIIKASGKRKEKTFLIEVFADSANESQTEAQLSYNTSLYKKIAGEGDLEVEAKESFKRLKDYLEVPELRYGFDIKMEKVKDTSFLVMSQLANDSNLQQRTDELFTSLINFANSNDAGYTGVRIFHKQNLKSGNYYLSGGIGVTKIFPDRVNAKIQYQRMPYNKNLLMLIYTGPYGELTRAYEALNLFALNNKFSSMAIPFEKWEDGPITVGDNDLVRLKVYLPVF